jgi:hypothetical protein
LADIFISYKSERRPAAEHLADVLQDHGYPVWFDYQRVTGADFGRQIERELGLARAVVVLWDRLSRDSDWVRSEARYAKRKGKFVSVRIDDCDLPVEFDGDQTIDLSRWSGEPRAFEPRALLVDRRGFAPGPRGSRPQEPAAPASSFESARFARPQDEASRKALTLRRRGAPSRRAGAAAATVSRDPLRLASARLATSPSRGATWGRQTAAACPPPRMWGRWTGAPPRRAGEGGSARPILRVPRSAPRRPAFKAISPPAAGWRGCWRHCRRS